MRKTLSLVLAVLMMVTLVAIPALADTNTPTDVSSIIKYYGVGSARTPWAAHATNGYNGVTYGNMVNITNKNLGVEDGFVDQWSKNSPTSTDASVTVETFEDSNVIKLAADATAAGGNPVNAGIGLNPVSGADLIAGATFTYNFRVYVPASDVALNFASVGVAKVEGDTLNYFLINQPVPTVTTATEQSVSNANRSTDPGFAKPIGVAPLFYHEGTTVKTILTNRHNKDTGLYLGGTGFGDGAKNYAGGGSLVYEKWYNYTVTLGYKEDVGLTVSLGADDTAFPETTNSTTTLPLTADELSALSATDVSLVISATGNTQIAGANRYVYIKDISYPATSSFNVKYSDKAIAVGSETFEGYELNTKNTVTTDSSILKFFGSYTTARGPLDKFESTPRDTMWAQVVENPLKVGNTSGKALNLHFVSNDATAYVGFATKAISKDVFFGKDGGTISFDMYSQNTSDPGAGRWFLDACDADGNSINTSSEDNSKSSRLMVHMTSGGNAAQFQPVQTTDGRDIVNLATLMTNKGWTTIEANIAPQENGKTTFRVRSKVLSTGTWSQWATLTDIVTTLDAYDYWSLAYGYNRAVNVDMYFDNIRVESSAVSKYAEVVGNEDDYMILPTSAITVTTAAPLNSVNANSVTLKDSAEETVEATIESAIVDGRQVITITPVELYAYETYTIDFGGAKDILGNGVANYQFTVAEGWEIFEGEPELNVSSDKVVSGYPISVALADTAVGNIDPSYYTVISNNDNVTIDVNEEGTYEVTANKNGASTLYIIPLLYPGIGVQEINVQSIVADNANTVTYYVDGEIAKIEVVTEYSIPEPFIPESESGIFNGWSLEEGGEIIELGELSSDLVLYANFTTPATVTFEAANHYGTLATTSVEVARGGKLSEIPEYSIDSNTTLEYWKINGTNYTTEELMDYTFNDDTTVTVFFKQTKLDKGVYDFSAMTAEEFALSPLKSWSKYWTEGVGIDLMTLKAAGHNNAIMNILADTENQAAEIEFTYVQTEGTDAFDGNFVSGNNVIQNWYQTPNNVVVKNGVNIAPLENMDSGADGEEHTIKFIFDDANDRMYVVKDGVAGATALLDSYGTLNDGLPTGFSIATKAKKNDTDSFVVKKITINRYETYDAPYVSITSGEGISIVGVSDAAGHILTTGIYMPTGSKVNIAAETQATYKLSVWEATNGTVENSTAKVTTYTAGTADATVSASGELHYVTATFSAGTNGAITSGDVTQTILAGKTPVAPSVTANEGWTFVGWEPEIGAIAEDTTYTAVYSDKPLIDINFNVNNSNFATIDATAKAIKDGKIIDLPSYVTKFGATLVEWKDEAGNTYTNTELLNKTFTATETITAMFKQVHVNGGVYDLTANDAKYSLFAGTNYTVNEDGSIAMSAERQTINRAFLNASSGVLVFTIDMKYNKGGNGFDMNIYNQDAGDAQGFFASGAKIHTKSGADRNYTPLPILGNNPGADGERHEYKLYFDFNDKSFRVSVDGVFTEIADDTFNAEQITHFSLALKADSGIEFYKFGAEYFDNSELTQYNFTTGEYDKSSAVVSMYSGKAYAGEQVYYKVDYNPDYVTFNGWNVNGEITSTDAVMVLTADKDYIVKPEFDITYVTLKFVPEEGIVTFTGEGVADDGTFTITVPKGSKPGDILGDAAFPTVVLDETYEGTYAISGWMVCNDEGAVISRHTSKQLLALAATENLNNIRVDIRPYITASVIGSEVSGEVGRKVSVPVTLEIDQPVNKVILIATYDEEILEYVDADIDPAYAGKVMVNPTTLNNQVKIDILTEEDIDINGVVASLNFKILNKIEEATNINYLYQEIRMSDMPIELTEESGYTPSVVTSVPLKGDVNSDGRIDVYDAVMVLKYLIGTAELDADGIEAAKVTGGDTVTTQDSITILKYIARLIASF